MDITTRFIPRHFTIRTFHTMATTDIQGSDMDFTYRLDGGGDIHHFDITTHFTQFTPEDSIMVDTTRSMDTTIITSFT